MKLKNFEEFCNRYSNFDDFVKDQPKGETLKHTFVRVINNLADDECLNDICSKYFDIDDMSREEIIDHLYDLDVNELSRIRGEVGEYLEDKKKREKLIFSLF